MPDVLDQPKKLQLFEIGMSASIAFCLQVEISAISCLKRLPSSAPSVWSVEFIDHTIGCVIAVGAIAGLARFWSWGHRATIIICALWIVAYTLGSLSVPSTSATIDHENFPPLSFMLYHFSPLTGATFGLILEFFLILFLAGWRRWKKSYRVRRDAPIHSP